MRVKVGNTHLLSAYFVFWVIFAILCNSFGLGYIFKKLNISNAINLIPLIEGVMNIILSVIVLAFSLLYTMDNIDKLTLFNAYLISLLISYLSGKLKFPFLTN